MTPSDAAMLATVDALAAQIASLRAQLVARAEQTERQTTPHADELVGADAFAVPITTWRRAVRAGEIEGAKRIGRRYLAPRSSVAAWLERQERPKAPTTPTTKSENATDELDRLIDRARRRAA
jgi:hypothetical protein